MVAYEGDRDNHDKSDQIDGDPGAVFHEFCFC